MKKITVDYKKVEELSYKGFINKDIATSLNISQSKLYADKKIMESIHNGRERLKDDVSQKFYDSLSDSPQNLQFLVKRLGLFNCPIRITKPSNTKNALGNLANAIVQYSDGTITESQIKTIEATLNSFIKGYDATVLEERIVALEEIHNANK